MTSGIKNVSLDVESWGTKAGDDLRSLGAVVFDPDTNMVLYPNPGQPMPLFGNPSIFYAACKNPLMGSYSSDHHTPMELDMIEGPNRRYNLSRNPDTVMWWYDQEQKNPQEYREAFWNPIDLKEVLLAFSFFILELSEDVRNGQAYDVLAWAHGAAFDPGLLIAAYEACGLTYPLFYRAPRDTRTIFDDAGIVNHSAHLTKHRYGKLHHALHDTITQARAICEARQIILGWRAKSDRLDILLNSCLNEKPTEEDLDAAATLRNARAMGLSKADELIRLRKQLEDEDAPIDSVLFLFMRHRIAHEKAIEKKLNALNRKFIDHKYMFNALYELLGPKAKEIADIWINTGVERTHTSWDPSAMNLSGEERAQILLDIEAAPKTEMTNIDGGLAQSRFDTPFEKEG